MRSKTLEHVIELLELRETVGTKTYGRTLDDQPDEGYEGKNWNSMMIEKLMDALMYAARENMALRNDRLKLMRANCAMARTVDGLRDKLSKAEKPYLDLSDNLRTRVRYDEVSGVNLG